MCPLSFHWADMIRLHLHASKHHPQLLALVPGIDGVRQKDHVQHVRRHDLTRIMQRVSISQQRMHMKLPYRRKTKYGEISRICTRVDTSPQASLQNLVVVFIQAILIQRLNGVLISNALSLTIDGSVVAGVNVVQQQLRTVKRTGFAKTVAMLRAYFGALYSLTFGLVSFIYRVKRNLCSSNLFLVMLSFASEQPTHCKSSQLCLLI